MAELTNLIVVESIAEEQAGISVSRERLNQSVKGLTLSPSDITFLAGRMGVQPGTVRGWLSPTSKSEMIPKSMVGRASLGGLGLSPEWRNRAVLGLALTGELASTDPDAGQRASYNDRDVGSLETVFRRLSSYTGYALDDWQNRGWRAVTIGLNKYGKWVIHVDYERVGSDPESRPAEQREIDYDEEISPDLLENWGLSDEELEAARDASKKEDSGW